MYKSFHYKILTSLLMIALSSNVFALNMTAEVDRTTITMNETLRLRVTIDRQGADKPDLSQLQLQFDILQQQQRSQTSIVNGRISATTQWLLIIAPKEAGDLIIPSLSSLGAFSDAISITVKPASSTHSSSNPALNNEDIYLESSIDKNQIYVQEQLLFTLRLYYRVSLSGYTPTEITLDNHSVGLTAENNYQKTVNGTPYNVLERIYAIHPQASGELAIPSQTWQVEKATGRRGFNSYNSPYLRLSSQPQTIKVLPIPTASTAEQWLPTSSLTIEQQWQQSLVTAKVGEPLTYTLTLTAQGSHHAQLPPINLQSNDDFTIYNDQAKTENTPTNKGVVGTRTINYAVIPKKTGRFALPPFEVTWWNTNTDQEEVITVTPEPIIVANSEITSDNSLPNIESPAPVVLKPSNNNASITWKISTVFFAILSGVFFILWYSNRRRIVHTTTAPTQHTDNVQSKGSPTLSSIYRDMDKAIKEQEWSTLQSLTLQWCAIKTQTAVHHTDDVIQHFPSLKEPLSQLNKQLYSTDAQKIGDYSQWLSMLKQQKIGTQSTHTQQAPLKPLYPH
jgi:hypothetical protein